MSKEQNNAILQNLAERQLDYSAYYSPEAQEIDRLKNVLLNNKFSPRTRQDIQRKIDRLETKIANSNAGLKRHTDKLIWELSGNPFKQL